MEMEESACGSTLRLEFAAGENFTVHAAAVLGGVHGGVCSAEQAVGRRAVIRIHGDSHAGGAAQDIALEAEGGVEASLEALRNLFDIGPAAHDRNNGRELVAAEPAQDIACAQLALHAQRNFLKIKIADVVAVEVVDQLEVVEIDVDEAKGSRILLCLLDLLLEVLVEREAVVHVGEQVKLGPMQQVAVKLSRLNGEGSEADTGSERFCSVFIVVFSGRFREGDKERSQDEAGAGKDFAAEDARSVLVGRWLAEARSVVDIAPAGCAIEAVGNHLGDVLDDVAQGFRAVDIFKDSAAALLKLGNAPLLRGVRFALRGDGNRLLVDASTQGPVPNAEADEDEEEESDQADQVADGEKRRSRGDGNIVRGAQQDVEGYAGIEGVRRVCEANAGDAHVGSDIHMLQGWSGIATRVFCRMFVDRGKEITAGLQLVFVFLDSANFGNDLAIDRDKVEEIRACGELLPGFQQRVDGRLLAAIRDFGTGQREESVMDIREAGGVGDVTDLERGSG